MRGFVITILLALASAAPQYNYREPNGFPQIRQNLIGRPDDHSVLHEALQNRQLAQAILGPATGANQQIQFQQQQPINFAGGLLQQQFVPQIQHQQLQQQQQQQFNYNTIPLAPVITKDIYVHAAPEEPEQKFHVPQQAILPPRKHYRIVFIKAPTERVSPATIRLTQAPTEEKTIIYVLSKKQDPLDLQTIFQQAEPKQPSKPEVYFIKYKTQEEAAHAQRSIQAQFDSLGGTSNVSDEGIAPVTSVIGSLQNQQSFIQPGEQSGSNLGGNKTPAYLPPAH